MTDFEDFSPSFQRIVRGSRSISGVERRLGRELTAGQVAVIDDFFEARRQQEELQQRRKALIEQKAPRTVRSKIPL